MLRSTQPFLKQAIKLSIRPSISSSSHRAMLPPSSNQVPLLSISRASTTDIKSSLSSNYDKIIRTTASSFSKKLRSAKSFLTKATSFSQPSIALTATHCAPSSSNQVPPPSTSRASCLKQAARLSCPLIASSTSRSRSSPNQVSHLVVISNYSSDSDQIIRTVSSSPPDQVSFGIAIAQDVVQSNCYQSIDDSTDCEHNHTQHELYHHKSYFERNSESCSLVGW